ncbi:MAG: hypothetical protein WC864_11010 [Ilumatobacteraceae bacterium]
MPRYIEKAIADPAGLRQIANLPKTLPYNLRPSDALRMVEDVNEMLHEVNCRLHGLGYDRLEELLDSAGFSGLVSRSVVDRLGRLSKALVPNSYHNGYPDLLPKGVYPGDAIQHGKQGGLEVKASRYDSGWQAHGPRAGWFCVVQFALDRRADVALQDREPTKFLAVHVAELEEADWSWQPAAAGKIRSGTASIKSTGEVKLRRGSVWVDPSYERDHELRLKAALLKNLAIGFDDMVHQALLELATTVDANLVAAHIAKAVGLDPSDIIGRIKSSLARLVRVGRATRPKRGQFLHS